MDIVGSSGEPSRGPGRAGFWPKAALFFTVFNTKDIIYINIIRYNCTLMNCDSINPVRIKLHWFLGEW